MVYRLLTALALSGSLVAACGGSTADCTLTADAHAGYRWGFSAGQLMNSARRDSADVDFTDPLRAYPQGYADGFLVGVANRHGGGASTSSTTDFPNSIGYQRGFRDGSQDGYADVSKASSTAPSGEFGDAYFNGFFDATQGKDSLCS